MTTEFERGLRAAIDAVEHTVLKDIHSPADALDAAMAAIAVLLPPASPGAGVDLTADTIGLDPSRTITERIHRNTDRHRAYLAARFPSGSSSPTTFMFEGHRWKYHVSSFDDAGEYDVIFRFAPDARALASSAQKDGAS